MALETISLTTTIEYDVNNIWLDELVGLLQTYEMNLNHGKNEKELCFWIFQSSQAECYNITDNIAYVTKELKRLVRNGRYGVQITLKIHLTRPPEIMVRIPKRFRSVRLKEKEFNVMNVVASVMYKQSVPILLRSKESQWAQLEWRWFRRGRWRQSDK